MSDIRFTINGQQFTINEYQDGWAWIHWDGSRTVNEGTGVAHPHQAQQAAVDYARKLIVEGSIMEDMHNLGLRLEYHNILCDRSQKLPPPFEEWKATRRRPVPQNPQTHADKGQPV